MKTLKEIKNEYAKKGYAFDNWNDLVDYFIYWDLDKLHNCIDDVMKEFALEVAKESLRNAAENAEAEYLCYKAPTVYDDSGHSITVNKESILSENNIPKL